MMHNIFRMRELETSLTNNRKIIALKIDDSQKAINNLLEDNKLCVDCRPSCRGVD